MSQRRFVFPRMDQPWLDALEELVPAVQTAFLGTGERSTRAEAIDLIEGGRAELARLRALDQDVRGARSGWSRTKPNGSANTWRDGARSPPEINSSWASYGRERVSVSGWGLAYRCSSWDWRACGRSDSTGELIRKDQSTGLGEGGRIGDRCNVEIRYCYTNSVNEVMKAFHAWDGSAEPKGWHRHPDSSRRRVNVDPAQEYLEP